MRNQQYNELLHTLGKEAISKMVKTVIRQNLPEPQATYYCQQFDDAKQLADFLEQLAKNMRGE